MVKSYQYLEDEVKRQMTFMPENHAERIKAMMILTKIYIG